MKEGLIGLFIYVLICFVLFFSQVLVEDFLLLLPVILVLFALLLLDLEKTKELDLKADRRIYLLLISMFILAISAFTSFSSSLSLFLDKIDLIAAVVFCIKSLFILFIPGILILIITNAQVDLPTMIVFSFGISYIYLCVVTFLASLTGVTNLLPNILFALTSLILVIAFVVVTRDLHNRKVNTIITIRRYHFPLLLILFVQSLLIMLVSKHNPTLIKGDMWYQFGSSLAILRGWSPKDVANWWGIGTAYPFLHFYYIAGALRIISMPLITAFSWMMLFATMLPLTIFVMSKTLTENGELSVLICLVFTLFGGLGGLIVMILDNPFSNFANIASLVQSVSENTGDLWYAPTTTPRLLFLSYNIGLILSLLSLDSFIRFVKGRNPRYLVFSSIFLVFTVFTHLIEIAFLFLPFVFPYVLSQKNLKNLLTKRMFASLLPGVVLYTFLDFANDFYYSGLVAEKFFLLFKTYWIAGLFTSVTFLLMVVIIVRKKNTNLVKDKSNLINVLISVLTTACVLSLIFLVSLNRPIVFWELMGGGNRYFEKGIPFYTFAAIFGLPLFLSIVTISRIRWSKYTPITEHPEILAIVIASLIAGMVTLLFNGIRTGLYFFFFLSVLAAVSLLEMKKSLRLTKNHKRMMITISFLSILIAVGTSSSFYVAERFAYESHFANHTISGSEIQALDYLLHNVRRDEKILVPGEEQAWRVAFFSGTRTVPAVRPMMYSISYGGDIDKPYWDSILVWSSTVQDFYEDIIKSTGVRYVYFPAATQIDKNTIIYNRVLTNKTLEVFGNDEIKIFELHSVPQNLDLYNYTLFSSTVKIYGDITILNSTSESVLTTSGSFSLIPQGEKILLISSNPTWTTDEKILATYHFSFANKPQPHVSDIYLSIILENGVGTYFRITYQILNPTSQHHNLSLGVFTSTADYLKHRLYYYTFSIAEKEALTLEAKYLLNTASYIPLNETNFFFDEKFSASPENFLEKSIVLRFALSSNGSITDFNDRVFVANPLQFPKNAGSITEVSQDTYLDIKGVISFYDAYGTLNHSITIPNGQSIEILGGIALQSFTSNGRYILCQKAIVQTNSQINFQESYPSFVPSISPLFYLILPISFIPVIYRARSLVYRFLKNAQRALSSYMKSF